MLSKLSKLVMGILLKKPMNPYELTKLAEMSVIQDWFPPTAQSIYTTVRNLHQKGLIEGEIISEEKLPPKTVYTLTDVGKQVFSTELLEGLESYFPEASDFGIALFHIGTLNKEEALLHSKHRLEKLEALYEKAKSRLDDCAPKIPFNMHVMLSFNVSRLVTEIKVTRELIEEIEHAEDWDMSFVRFMK
jgi:DNA-binding PadR family transcriptional regulator